MKKILVLTDLSDTAAQAAQAAVFLCAKMRTNLILLHTWTVQPALAEYPNNSWGIDTLVYGEQSKEKLTYLREELLETISRLPAAEHHASIDWQQEDGGVADCAESRLKKGDIDLIVMGASAGSKLEHLITGSDANAVISRVNRPVLVVPGTSTLEKLKKVTFATDFSAGDIAAVHYLTRLGRQFNFQIAIVHIAVFGADDSDALERQNSFQQHVAKFNYKDLSYQKIHGNDVTGRLQNLCKENGSDLLVLSHDHHSFWHRLFKGTYSQDILRDQTLPVMFIPAALGEGGL